MLDLLNKIHITNLITAHYDSQPENWKKNQRLINNYPDGLPTNEFIYRLSGEITTTFDGITLDNKADTIEYLPKGGGARGQYNIVNKESGPCIIIFFDTDAPLFSKATLIDATRNYKYRELFVEMARICTDRQAGYYCEALSVLYKILYLIVSDSNEQKYYSLHYRKIKNGVSYINAHFKEPDIDFNYVAETCRMSYSNFRRLFTECMGISPTKYLINKKIEYAKDLLATGQCNVSGAAYSVGYSDIYYFSRIFKKVTGYAPSKYLCINI